MTDEQKRELDAAVRAAFAEGQPERSFAYGKKPESDAEFLARNSASARKVYELTRALGLERQLMADAPAWKPPAGIAVNAFTRRRLAGLIGETLPGYPFDDYGRARVAALAKKPARKRAVAASTCPHCGGSLKEAA